MRAWKLANFRNLALTCFAYHTLNSNFINFPIPNEFLSNITIVPHTKTFPTITHMPILGFSKWYFRRGEWLGSIVEFMLKSCCTSQFRANYTSKPLAFELSLHLALLLGLVHDHASPCKWYPNSCTRIISHFTCCNTPKFALLIHAFIFRLFNIKYIAFHHVNRD